MRGMKGRIFKAILPTSDLRSIGEDFIDWMGPKDPLISAREELSTEPKRVSSFGGLPFIHLSV